MTVAGCIEFKTRFGGKIVRYSPPLERTYHPVLASFAQRFYSPGRIGVTVSGKSRCSSWHRSVPGARMLGSGNHSSSGVAYDSRLVQPGYLFAALRGADLDGHTFVQEAERRGAAALLVEVAAHDVIAADRVNDSRALWPPFLRRFSTIPPGRLESSASPALMGKRQPRTWLTISSLARRQNRYDRHGCRSGSATSRNSIPLDRQLLSRTKSSGTAADGGCRGSMGDSGGDVARASDASS